ncbi:MAG TPA: hypothetical protein VFH94_15035 [Streptomyces sp.]|nr:hypothetical protein [Streptomyces sp.]
MSRLDLTGLDAGPAQVWGGVRLVPLLREQPVAGLRLHEELLVEEEDPDTCPSPQCLSYVPHGLVASWPGSDDAPSAAYGSRLTGDGRPDLTMKVPHDNRRKPPRDQQRGPGGRVRFLPLHLALEGYFALHYGAPAAVWWEWSQQALREGLSPRAQDAYLGRPVRGLADALRVFEILPGQCGVMVYVADSLAAAFVTPHPGDYRALHPSLVEDLYGELVHHHAFFGGPVRDFDARIRDTAHLRTVADLRAATRAQARAWRETHDGLLADALLSTPYAFDRVQSMGSFALWRFQPPYQRGGQDQHIGEMITDHKGRVAYLKTFRLSESQVRRGHLLSLLASHGWHPGRTAEALSTTPKELARRINRAGFDSLVAHRAPGSLGQRA